MNKLIVAAAVIASALCSVASAKDYSSTSFTSYSSQPLNEVTTNLTQGYFYSGNRYKDGDSGSAIVASASYLRYLKDGWQVGGEGGLQILSEEWSGTRDSETLLTVVGIGAYNFESDIKTSLYAKAGVGLYPVLDNMGEYKSQLGFFIGGGKRFQIFNSITYTPELRLEKKGDLDLGVNIAFLNFSLFWN
ncbi:hypothetical protein B9G69_001280 [Bdellovibrio sp. SKB1291214]|uniref:hypothetical protein n=1 Tax=Bdellovibrio sp. SKB1291214 TaxID=1732569 RepID=UPI000B51C3F3|nr:hypothetical protein [Bdellovibrio sp. SKB1291214]UYL09208.1 hypothetical protein B9G69_001280 [Bdellovibrio sp. SKB1291214]